jgi:hypothetical protein
MTLGGFTSLVNIKRSRFSGGFTDGKKPYFNAEMEMEGKLLVFHYGTLREQISRETKTSVSVEIEFTETQEVAVDTQGEDKAYIGTIQLFADENEEKYVDDFEIGAVVRITLPIAMFSQLSSWEGKSIRFETIHDIIKHPTVDQKQIVLLHLLREYTLKLQVNCRHKLRKSDGHLG